MQYIEHIPAEPLHEYVEKIWYCQAVDFTATHLTIPLLHHELVFNFSDNYRVWKAGNKTALLNNPSSWVSGLQSGAFYSRAEGRHEMLGVLFRPRGLKAFTRFASRDFADNFIDAGFIFGSAIETITDKLYHAPSPQQKFALVENFLLNQLIDISPPGYLDDSIAALKNSMGDKGFITRISKRVVVSNKSLIQAFNKFVGINPGGFSQLQAVNKAIVQLTLQPAQSLTSLAYGLNFYDQSHFIHIFKKITSVTPSAFSKFIQNEQVDAVTPNFIRVAG